MMFFQMSLVQLTAIEHFRTLVDFASWSRFLTAPGLDLVMSSVFMPFPVVFASEAFETCRIGTSVWTCMALLVLSDAIISYVGL